MKPRVFMHLSVSVEGPHIMTLQNQGCVWYWILQDDILGAISLTWRDGVTMVQLNPEG